MGCAYSYNDAASLCYGSHPHLASTYACSFPLILERALTLWFACGIVAF